MLYTVIFFTLAACKPIGMVHAGEKSEGFKSQDFLKLADEEKKFWLHGAMLAFSHMAAAKKHSLGQCVHSWYFSEDINYKDGLILASMRKYSDVSPTAVLLALAEHQCGKFRG